MAEQEIVKIINIKTDQAINTVKELKSYINELRDDLVKVDKNSKEYEETLEEIAKAQTKLTEVTKDSKNAMNYAEGSYRSLNQELVNLRNEYKNLSEQERNSAAVGGAMLSRIQELDAELKDIDATLGNHQRNVGNYKSAIEDVTVSYASQSYELKALRVALEQLDPTTEQYNKLFNRAAEITHNLAYQQEMLKYSSRDLGDQLSNIRGIAANMAAGFSAVNAAMGLFGNNNEDVKKALLKTQQAMAIVQGLQGMDGLLKRTQGLSTAMKVWYSSTIQATAGLGKAAAATKVLTTAQKGLNAAMKANPIGIILTAVMALSVGIKPLINWIEKLTGKFDKMNSSASASTASMAELDKTISEIDRENNLEAKLMQASGFSQIAVIQKQIEGEQKKLNEETKEYAKQVSILKDNIYLYSKQNTITTGTLKEMGYNEEQIKIITEELKGKVVESDKVLKNFTKNDGFKTMLDNVLQLNTGIKDIRKNIQNLQDDSKVASVKSAVDAAKEAARKREEIERNYQSKIQNVYGTTIRETINTYKDELGTLKDFLTIELNNPKNSKEVKNQIKDLIEKQINPAIKEVGSIDIFNLENSKSSIGKNFEGLKKVFQERLKDAIENSGERAQRKVNDEIVQLFVKAKDVTDKELRDLYNEYDRNKFNLQSIFEVEGGKENEKAMALEKFKVELIGLETELTRYREIKKFVEEGGFFPSDEYDNAIQKMEELNTKITEVELERVKTIQEINKKYFLKDVEDAKTYTDAKIRAITNEYEKATQTGNWWEMLTPVSPEQERAYMDEIYNAQLEGLEKIKTLWEQRKSDLTLSYEDRLEAEKNYNLAVMDIEDAQLEYEIGISEKRKEIVQQYVDMTKDAVGEIANLFGALADIYEEDIKAKQKAGKMSDKEADRAFESVKGMRIAEAVINTLAGSIGAFLQASATYPPPYGQIIGGVTAAAVTASGIAQIMKIKSSTRDSSAGSAASSASVPAPDTSYDYQPMYVSNTTGQQDTEYLRNSLTEQPIRAYVVESEVTEVQDRVRKRQNESDF